MNGDLKLFAGRSHPAFAEAVARHLGVALGKVAIGEYANENLYVKVQENVRGQDVFVIQTSCPPVHRNLMELFMLLDALKYASAGRITAVIPYFPYVRSDKKDEPRISIAARLVAELLETAGADRLLTANLHAMQIMAFARIPVDQLDGIPVLCQAIRAREVRDFVAVAPDIGRAKVTEAYARWLDLEVAVADKRRDPVTGIVKVDRVIGDVESKDVLLLDDEILTGGSIIAAIEALRRKGARRFLAACVHGVLAAGAFARMKEAGLEGLVTTDTLPLEEQSGAITVCSLAPLFAEAIRAIHTGRSVSQLFAKP